MSDIPVVKHDMPNNTFHKVIDRITQSMIEVIEMDEKEKALKKDLIDKQKVVIPGKLYVAYYKIYQNDNASDSDSSDDDSNDNGQSEYIKTKLESKIIGIFDSHYLAMKACELAQSYLLKKINVTDNEIVVNYVDYNLNAFYNLMYSI